MTKDPPALLFDMQREKRELEIPRVFSFAQYITPPPSAEPVVPEEPSAIHCKNRQLWTGRLTPSEAVILAKHRPPPSSPETQEMKRLSFISGDGEVSTRIAPLLGRYPEQEHLTKEDAVMEIFPQLEQ